MSIINELTTIVSIKNMRCEILYSGCAVAEFAGTSVPAEQLLKNYVESRNEKCNIRLGITSAHNFVIMSFNEDSRGGLKEYVRRNKLGTIQQTKPQKNINHTGWGSKGTKEVYAVLYTPDHEALTRWYQKKFDANYQLK